MKYPQDCPVFKHRWIGIVTGTGERYYNMANTLVVMVDSKAMHCQPYAYGALLESLRPLTRSAREMLAIAKAGG